MGSLTVKEIIGLEAQRECLGHLLKDIEILDQMIVNDLLETGITRIGAEQEMCLTDLDFHPSKKALKILEKLDSDYFTTELALFNMELNIRPVELRNKCFSDLEAKLKTHLARAYASAKAENVNVILTGILPTIKQKNLYLDHITPLNRYTTLNKILKKIRGNEFKLHIKGVHQFIVTHRSILFEACNTSFQVHLQLDPTKMIDEYNWAQAIAGPVLSVVTNSPLLMGRELWSETRIALFQQSVDLRNASYLLREQKARVAFGTNWIKESILELYRDDIARYSPILTSEEYENSEALFKSGSIPKLTALNLFNGTLYKWNRLCYGVSDGKPHLRIENRYIPAGPTLVDEVANTAFWVGLMKGLPDKYCNISSKMDFDDARGNFVRAARTGLQTCFDWFGKTTTACELILDELLPIARHGLRKEKVSEQDIKYYLGIIEKRVKAKETGSSWMIKNHRALRKKMTRESANYALTEEMYKNQSLNLPITEWPKMQVHQLRNDDFLRKKVERFMSTELFVVNENSLVELIEKVMKWKKINHIPVVNKENKLVGLITRNRLQNYSAFDSELPIMANEIMEKELFTISPEKTMEEAERIMKEKEIGCLPVLDKSDLVGIITRHDFEKRY
ncbi:CBS domain-containing protein [Namhaeicola litoreus]|uniref:CBS domain-containing protein n=1 Tax=Namhaeicola litoreus TaxID=1052145 RepID=A0ABW3Y2D9_9FLAO